MRERFKSVNLRAASVALVDTCNEIIEEYQEQGLRLTLRQLYYQLVSRNVIPNVERSYKNLSSLLNDARIGGYVDWDAIEDRVRRPRAASEWNSIADLVDTAVRSFRLPRWEGQEAYAELWVEKDALAGVLEPLSREYHVTLMVNRGYSSASAMYESSKRFIENSERDCRLFYLGDFDPSGEDMVRDVGARLEMFGANVTVEKIALTMNQIRQYNPPPNPAKRTDPRAAEFIAKNGTTSYEVDALPPNILSGIVRQAFAKIIDVELMNEIIAKEEIGKKKLVNAAKKIEV